MSARTASSHVVLAGVAAVALASCGGSTSTTPPLNYTGALLRPGEQTGYTVSDSPKVAATPSDCANLVGDTGAQAKQDIALLTTSGYGGGANEPLTGADGREGFSLVALATPAAVTKLSQALYNSAVSAQKSQTVTLSPFSVPGIPSARGVTAQFGGGKATSNVYWTYGRCVLGSGLYLPEGTSSYTAAQINAPVITGATSQDARIAGYCQGT